MPDPHHLSRFVTAQNDGVYERAAEELRNGRKTGHWMWFVFPQIAGLGSSAMAREYAISSLEEARAYLRHPVLGPRLRECAALTLATAGRSATEILGPVDAMKLRSSMTLFAAAAGQDDDLFTRVLDTYFDGVADQNTTDRLG